MKDSPRLLIRKKHTYYNSFSQYFEGYELLW